MESNSRNCNSKSSSKSENEGFIIQKTPSLKLIKRNIYLFFLTLHFTTHFYTYSYVTLFFFLIQILILFSFTSITIHQSRERDRERELRKQNVGLVLARMGDDGFQNFCLEYANLVIATGNGGFRCQFGTVYGGAIQSTSKSTTVKFPNICFFFFFNI